MAKLNIILHPDPRLKKACPPVADISADLRRLADDMLTTMYEAPGIGLAAPQVGHLERMLVMDIRTETGDVAGELRLSLSPLRGIIKDYFAICESYFDAVRRLPPSKIEAIDMGRRGIHNEGAQILTERLGGKIEIDNDTARRLFTVICALQFRG